MKKLLVLLMIVSSLFAAKGQVHKNDKLCKFFTKKVQDYKKNMRQDPYAYKTLKSYEKRAQMFCK